MALCTMQSQSQPFTIKETTFIQDKLTLVADIYTPGKPVGVGVAIIQGSGNSDRSNAWSKAFAEILASNGYHVLLPDKRGCGKSQGDWKKSSMQELAVDALGSVKHLKQITNLNAAGVMGLSQGGFIAPVAAASGNEIDFVIDISGATVSLEEQIIIEVSNTAR